MQQNEPTPAQHDKLDAEDIDTALNAKCGEIRALLPDLKRLVEAFGELHELLDERGQVADFDTGCMHEFGVVPELLREATERL